MQMSKNSGVAIIFNIGGYIFTRVGSYNRGKNKNIMWGGDVFGKYQSQSTFPES